MKFMFRTFVICLFRFPFNMKTPVGYAVSSVIQAISFMVLCYTVMCAIGMLFGFIGLMITFAKNIQRKIQDFDKNFRVSQNRSELKVAFLDVLRRLLEAKELSAIL